MKAPPFSTPTISQGRVLLATDAAPAGTLAPPRVLTSRYGAAALVESREAWHSGWTARPRTRSSGSNSVISIARLARIASNARKPGLVVDAHIRTSGTRHGAITRWVKPAVIGRRRKDNGSPAGWVATGFMTEVRNSCRVDGHQPLGRLRAMLLRRCAKFVPGPFRESAGPTAPATGDLLELWLCRRGADQSRFSSRNAGGVRQ